MITVEHLTKFYGDHKAVDDISFAIDEGHVYGFLGPNGADRDADVYFTTLDAESLPLDTDRVENYLQAILSLGLMDYVTYNATEDELKSYGLDAPALTVTAVYPVTDEDGIETEQTFILNISLDPTELAAAAEAAYAEAVHSFRVRPPASK